MFAVALISALMYLVLFASLALNMRSSAVQGTDFKTRVEARPVLGQVFYFLYHMGLGVGEMGGFLSLCSPGNVTSAQLEGKLVMVIR